MQTWKPAQKQTTAPGHWTCFKCGNFRINFSSYNHRKGNTVNTRETHKNQQLIQQHLSNLFVLKITTISTQQQLLKRPRQ